MKTYISSRTNETVVALAKLKDKKERDNTSLYLCEGYKLCKEAVGLVQVKYALVRENEFENEE